MKRLIVVALFLAACKSPTQPALEGDFNGNRAYDVEDFFLLSDAINSGSWDLKYDLNGDEKVDIEDYEAFTALASDSLR